MITRDNVKHVAKLAKLEFAEAELDRFTDEFNKIIGLFEHLEEVDTTGVKPTYHGNDLINVYREDIPTQGVNRDALLANTKTSKDGFIQVPAIMDGGEA